MSIYQHGFSKMWSNVCISSDFSKSLVSLFISQSVLCWCEISECMFHANWLDSDITVSPINRLSWNSSDKSDMIRGSIVGWLVDNYHFSSAGVCSVAVGETSVRFLYTYIILESLFLDCSMQNWSTSLIVSGEVVLWRRLAEAWRIIVWSPCGDGPPTTDATQPWGAHKYVSPGLVGFA